MVKISFKESARSFHKWQLDVCHVVLLTGSDDLGPRPLFFPQSSHRLCPVDQLRSATVEHFINFSPTRGRHYVDRTLNIRSAEAERTLIMRLTSFHMCLRRVAKKRTLTTRSARVKQSLSMYNKFVLHFVLVHSRR